MGKRTMRTREILIVIDELVDHVVVHYFCKQRRRREDRGLEKRGEGEELSFVLRRRRRRRAGRKGILCLQLDRSDRRE